MIFLLGQRYMITIESIGTMELGIGYMKLSINKCVSMLAENPAPVRRLLIANQSKPPQKGGPRLWRRQEDIRPKTPFGSRYIGFGDGCGGSCC